MKILIPNHTGTNALAKEIGLEESKALLALEAAIQTSGVRRSGTKMIARTSKDLADLLGWCNANQARKLYETLRNQNYVFIDDETLFDSKSAWYGLHWPKIKTLTSIVVMDDGEIEEAHEPKEKVTKTKPLGTNGFSRAHQVLFGAFIRACDFRQALLTPRDRSEIGESVKKLLVLYAGQPVETEEIERAVLGFRTWWVDEGKKYNRAYMRTAPRPFQIISNWGKYETSVKQSGVMPDIQED